MFCFKPTPHATHAPPTHDLPSVEYPSHPHHYQAPPLIPGPSSSTNLTGPTSEAQAYTHTVVTAWAPTSPTSPTSFSHVLKRLGNKSNSPMTKPWGKTLSSSVSGSNSGGNGGGGGGVEGLEMAERGEGMLMNTSTGMGAGAGAGTGMGMGMGMSTDLNERTEHLSHQDQTQVIALNTTTTTKPDLNPAVIASGHAGGWYA